MPLQNHTKISIGISFFTLLLLPSPLLAQTEVRSREPALLMQLRQCQGLQNDTERLDCFDRGMASLNEAQQAGDLAIIDRSQIQQTKRQLFGFESPDISRLFGDNQRAAADEINQIETTLISAHQDHNGRWLLVLADGSSWRQTDNSRKQVRNIEGSPVAIHRASLGSYLMNVGRTRGLRVQRH